MKRNLILAFTLLVLSTQLVFAQRMRPGMEGPKKPTIEQRIKNLDAALHLTADQKKAIQKIFKDADSHLKKFYELNKGNRRALRAAALDQKEKSNAQIMNLLNDSQKEKYKNYLKNRPHRPMKNRRPRSTGKRGGMMRF